MHLKAQNKDTSWITSAGVLKIVDPETAAFIRRLRGDSAWARGFGGRMQIKQRGWDVSRPENDAPKRKQEKGTMEGRRSSREAKRHFLGSFDPVVEPPLELSPLSKLPHKVTPN